MRRFMLWAFRSYWFQRTVMGIAIAANVVTMFTAHPGVLWWWFSAAMVALMLIAQIFVERNRRIMERWREDMRWQLAAESEDPITALAMVDYLDTLSLKQIQTMTDWLRTHDGADLADAPPEVLGFVERAHPPREQ